MFGLAGSMCLARTQPSLYFSPRPGLIPALTKAQSLAPHQAHSPPQEQRLDTPFPPPFQSEATTETQDVQVTRTDGFPSRSTTLGKSLQQRRKQAKVSQERIELATGSLSRMLSV